jgi:hypothetical protein
VLTVFLLVGTFSLASCSRGGEGEEFMDYEGLKAEYLRKVQGYDFPLPEGVAFPDEPPRPTEPTLHQQGNGIVYADNFWMCAWMFEWLETREQDAGRASTAMQWLERAPETEFMRKYLASPGAQIWMEEVLGKAKLGDLTIFRDFYAQCPESATS